MQFRFLLLISTLASLAGAVVGSLRGVASAFASSVHLDAVIPPPPPTTTSKLPSRAPTRAPTIVLTRKPSQVPSRVPSLQPTIAPTSLPSPKLALASVTFVGGPYGFYHYDTSDFYPTSAFTVSTWIKTTQTDAAFLITLGRSKSTNYVSEFGLYLNAGKVGYYELNESGFGIRLSTTTAVNTGSNIHVAFVKNDNLGQFYINGVATDSSRSLNAVNKFNSELYLGSDSGTTKFFVGEMSNLKLFDTALTAAQVAAFASSN